MKFDKLLKLATIHTAVIFYLKNTVTNFSNHTGVQHGRKEKKR